MKINDITIEILDDDVIKIENFSGEKYRVIVSNPKEKYNGYVNFNFNDHNWVTTKPKEWPFSPTNEIVKIYLVAQSKMVELELDLEKKNIKDVTDYSIFVENFDPQKRNVSFIVPAYKTEKYLNDTIYSILSLENDYTDLEIIVGIDADQNVLQLVSKTDYPENVKFYLFEKNIGLFHNKNTMVTKSKYENIIFFDSDDIAHKNLLKSFFRIIKDNEIVRWKCLKFKDNTDYNIEENLTKNDHFIGGCFGINKKVFLENNGFQPWRCHADSEFMQRVDLKYKTIYLNEYLYYYRVRQDSLTNHPSTTHGSIIREAYKRIMEEKINTKDFKNPERLYVSDCIFIK